MTEEELAQGLMEQVAKGDTENILDPDGHYAFSVTAFVRPDNPEEWVGAASRADKKAAVGCASFVLGGGDDGPRTIEQICAVALKALNSQQLHTVMAEAQAAVRKREELLHD